MPGKQKDLLCLSLVLLMGRTWLSTAPVSREAVETAGFHLSFTLSLHLALYLQKLQHTVPTSKELLACSILLRHLLSWVFLS